VQFVSGNVAEISRQTMKIFYGVDFEALVGTTGELVNTPPTLMFVAGFSRSSRP
jgi:hypothetical protein